MLSGFKKQEGQRSMPKCIRRTLCNYTAVLDIFFSFHFILAIYDSKPIDSGI
jgi:hypothetical protein